MTSHPSLLETTPALLLSSTCRDSLINAIKVWGFREGFVLYISASTSDIFTYLHCTQGQFSSEVDSVLDEISTETHDVVDCSRSIKQDCTFRVYLSMENSIWKVKSSDGTHNHPKLPNLSGYSGYRLWWAQQHMEELHSYFVAEMTPKKILNLLSAKYPKIEEDTLSHCPLTKKDIGNRKTEWKRKRNEGLSSLSWLISQLQDQHEWLYNIAYDGNGSIRNLFIKLEPGNVEVAENPEQQNVEEQSQQQSEYDVVLNELHMLSETSKVMILPKLKELLDIGLKGPQPPVVATKRTRGRPPGSKNKQIRQRRDPSLFEHVRETVISSQQ
ncbi:hypothetical protein P9112_004619 [Eukaryota sp. TZLM1-RC]